MKNKIYESIATIVRWSVAGFLAFITALPMMISGGLI